LAQYFGSLLFCKSNTLTRVSLLGFMATSNPYAPVQGIDEERDSEQQVSATTETRGAKAKRIGKTLLDYSSILSGLIGGFSHTDNAIFVTIYVGAGLAFVALVVDFFNCRRRLAAGLPAMWPKLVILVPCLSNVTMIPLLHAKVLTVVWLQTWGGVLGNSLMAVASVGSVVINKPWIYASAVESMSPEKLRLYTENEQARMVFEGIMRGLTNLWSVVFVIFTCTSIAAALLRENGQSVASTVLSIAVPVAGVPIVLHGVQPKVVEGIKKNKMEKMTREMGAQASANTQQSPTASAQVPLTA